MLLARRLRQLLPDCHSAPRDTGATVCVDDFTRAIRSWLLACSLDQTLAITALVCALAANDKATRAGPRTELAGNERERLAQLAGRRA